MEHHSNIVPWQMLCEERQARLRVIPMNDRGELVLDEYGGSSRRARRSWRSPTSRTRSGRSIRSARWWRSRTSAGSRSLVDGAQAVPHLAVDVRALDADFYAFSAHKMFGPTGVGVLYGKTALLEAMPPYQGGGDMIRSVTFEKTIYADLPYKFEAGTPNIGGGIGLGAAIDYLQQVGIHAVESFEHELLAYATEKLQTVPGLRIIGTAKEKAGVLSFVMEGIHPHDIGTILDTRASPSGPGHHCAQPVMQRFGVPATARASFAFYNTKEEVDALRARTSQSQEVLR